MLAAQSAQRPTSGFTAATPRPGSRKPNLSFQTAVAYSSGGYFPRWVAVADVNRDGKPDLVVAN